MFELDWTVILGLLEDLHRCADGVKERGVEPYLGIGYFNWEQPTENSIEVYERTIHTRSRSEYFKPKSMNQSMISINKKCDSKLKVY